MKRAYIKLRKIIRPIARRVGNSNCGVGAQGSLRVDWTTTQFREVAAPVVESDAFSRLRRITFLGVLSPYYKELSGFPITYRPTAPRRSDRTRAHHSFSVAWLMGRLCAKLQLSKPAVDYAVMWGLVHDIATWPLSHTGEAAFARSTETAARELRAMMLLGSDRLPKALSLYPLIKAASLDHGTLIALFDKRTTGFDWELAVVHKLVHSVLTPDTIEGMHRTGSVFNVAVPQPKLFLEALERDLVSGVRVRQSSSSLVFKFWRGKSKIYSDFINTSKTIEFESIWSRAIQDSFAKTSLREFSELSESEVIRRVVDAAVGKSKEVQRYKDPLSYVIADRYKRHRTFGHPMPIEGLSTVFVRRKR